MITPSLRKLAVPIDSVTPHPRNARQGDVGAIVLSLRRFGQVRPIVVQKSTGYIVAGNHVHAGMKAEGETKVAAVLVELDDEEALAYLIADNRTADLGTYDDQGIAEILVELRAAGLLDGTGYDDEDTDRLLADLARDAAGPAPSEEAGVPDALTEDPVSREGEVYQLGPHRLICGDATDPAVLALLMEGDEAACLWTDPPYGVDYAAFASADQARALNHRTDGKVVAGDAAQELPSLLAAAFSAVDAVLAPGAPLYVAHPASGLLGVEFSSAMTAVGWEVRQTLIWAKGKIVPGNSDYHYDHEPIFYGFKPAAGRGRLGRGGRRWFGDSAQGTVFYVARPQRSEHHPTMKPVELVRAMLANSLPPSGIVLDPFAGSGTTMLAAQALGRTAYLAEIDPRYCDVIRARYEAAVLHVPTTVGAPA